VIELAIVCELIVDEVLHLPEGIHGRHSVFWHNEVVEQ